MISHLIELRRRLLMVLGTFIVFFIFLFFFANYLFQLVIYPIAHVLSSHESLIATQVASSVLTPLSLAIDIAILCTSPMALYHLWRFIAPALYRHERQRLSGIILSSLILFMVGVLFCFYIALPFIFQFFAQAMPAGVKLMPDINNALAFIMHMLLLFGLCFQLPLVCVILVNQQWVSLTTLKTIRPYFIVAAFIVGMLLTPPDVLSQVMLAVPLCLLYEIGILAASWQQKYHTKKI